MTDERPESGTLEGWGLALGIALAAALMIPLRGYLTDDTFIHLQYARHLAAGQGLVFNLGERVYGCTSPLWVALLADGIALGWEGVRWARVLGAMATLASVVLFYLLLRRTVTSPVLRIAGTVAWASHAWMARWSLSGMETPLAVALTLAGFVSFVSGPSWGSRPGRTGLWWALAALARPELVLLLLLWGVLLLAGAGERGGLRRWVAGVLPALMIYGGWLLYAWSYFHAPWPQTLAAKAAGSTSLAFHLDNLWRQVRVVGATDAVIAVVAVCGLLPALRRGPGAPGAVLGLLPWLWVAGLPLLYLARGVPVLSRYLLVAVPVMHWLAWRALDAWSARDPRRAGRWAVGLALLIVGQNLVVHRLVVVPQVETFTAALERELIPWGRWFREHGAPRAAIATPDIGVLGYFSERPVVDLAGLVTPRMAQFLEHESLEDAVAAFRFAAIARPEYLVDRGGPANRLVTASPYGASLEPLGTARMPNLGVARAEPAVYSFYRVDWGTFDSLRVARGR